MISDDLASSRFIRNVELPRIRERYTGGRLSIIPVLASPVSEAGRDELEWVFELQIVPGEDCRLINKRVTTPGGTIPGREFRTRFTGE
jgi:hypothetical protein